MGPAIRRIAFAFALLLTVVALGGLGYSLLGKGMWSFGESIYFAIITVSTVGFGELHDVERVRGARLLTGVLILFGSAALVFFQSNITAALVESSLGQAFRRKRMQNQIKALKGHVVVCGVGSTGKFVAEELWAIGTPFVAVDTNLDQLHRISQEVADGKMLYIHGDATQDHVLIEARVTEASGVVAALTSDRENLFVTLSARSLNANARIIAKVVEVEARKKMIIAGASNTVSPNIIGGRQMASEIVRPEVMVFLDQMLRDKDKNLRFEEIVIPEGSSFVGQTLRDVPFRGEGNVLVVAVRAEDGVFVYSPGPKHRLEAGSVLIVLGASDGVRKVRTLVDRSGKSTSVS